MSGHTKGLPIKRGKSGYFDVRIDFPGGNSKSYQIPISKKQNVNAFLKNLDVGKEEIDDWHETTPSKVVSKERLEKYKKAGIALRGARYRENLSQVELAKISGVSQNEISKIENGKRTVGKKVAHKLAKALKIDYRFLTEDF